MLVPRLPLALIAVLATLFGLGWLADSVAAVRVERAISTGVEDRTNLDVSPAVAVGGVPYLQALISGEVPVITVNALDVDVRDLGMVNARTALSQVSLEPDQVLDGDIDGAAAALLTRTIGLDGVAFGRLLDMTDLDIANPYDISPGGGVTSEAQLTGTPPGFDAPVTVVVDLRLVGPDFHMTPRELHDAPADRTAEVREAFTLTLDTRDLPLAGRATSVHLGGGSIYFEAQRHNVTVRLADLSPVDTSGRDLAGQ